MRFDLVLFDCDGVLVDSEPISNRILSGMLGEEGLPMSLEETMRTFIGRSAATCLAMIEERLGRRLPHFVARWDERLFEAFRREVQPIRGVEEVLDALDAPFCVASSGSHERMRVTLGTTGLLPRFEGRLFSATDVALGKPHPDLFLHAARVMGAMPSRCAVVEDTPIGVRAGVAAGMMVYGYAAASGTPPEALAAEGAVPFGDMRDLVRLLR